VEFTTPEGGTIALDAVTPKMSDKAGVFLALESDDIKADFARLKAAGARVARDLWTNNHGEGDVCHMAVLLDPDGNSVVLHQVAAGRDW
jgi:predicted enzyme related to lactoylglutathione lyase